MTSCTFCLGPRQTCRWRVAMMPFDRLRPLSRTKMVYFCCRACMRWWLRRYVA